MSNEIKKIRITKLSGKPVSSIEVGYWVIGFRLGVEPVIGLPYMLMPIEETSLKEYWFDWFSTTDVSSYEDGVITTKNSKWKLEIL